MDHYSQQKIKSAATDPEHVVRKIELDQKVGDLADLATASKSTVVSAINEVNANLLGAHDASAIRYDDYQSVASVLAFLLGEEIDYTGDTLTLKGDLEISAKTRLKFRHVSIYPDGYIFGEGTLLTETLDNLGVCEVKTIYTTN